MPLYCQCSVLCAAQLGSEIGDGSIDGQVEGGGNESLASTISSVKAASETSEQQLEPVPNADLTGQPPISQSTEVVLSQLRETSARPEGLLFGTTSELLAAPAATTFQPAAPLEQPQAGGKERSPAMRTPGIPTPTPPAQPLPLANAWRKPLQGTPSGDKPAAAAAAADAQAPRAAAEAATVDQASVAAVTGAVPADSGRGGRGHGRTARGRDRDQTQREPRDPQGVHLWHSFTIRLVHGKSLDVQVSLMPAGYDSPGIAPQVDALEIRQALPGPLLRFGRSSRTLHHFHIALIRGPLACPGPDFGEPGHSQRACCILHASRVADVYPALQLVDIIAHKKPAWNRCLHVPVTYAQITSGFWWPPCGRPVADPMMMPDLSHGH